MSVNIATLIYKVTWDVNDDADDPDLEPYTFEQIKDIYDLDVYTLKEISLHGIHSEKWHNYKEVYHININCGLDLDDRKYFKYLMSITKEYHRNNIINNILI